MSSEAPFDTAAVLAKCKKRLKMNKIDPANWPDEYKNGTIFDEVKDAIATEKAELAELKARTAKMAAFLSTLGITIDAELNVHYGEVSPAVADTWVMPTSLVPKSEVRRSQQEAIQVHTSGQTPHESQKADVVHKTASPRKRHAEDVADSEYDDSAHVPKKSRIGAHKAKPVNKKEAPDPDYDYDERVRLLAGWKGVPWGPALSCHVWLREHAWRIDAKDLTYHDIYNVQRAFFLLLGEAPPKNIVQCVYAEKEETGGIWGIAHNIFDSSEIIYWLLKKGIQVDPFATFPFHVLVGRS